MARNAVIAVGVVAVLAAGCSGDDGEAERADRPFCVVQEEIDDRLSAAFAESDEDATEEDLDEALVEAADDLRDDGVLDDAREAAPDEVAGPTGTVMSAIEAMAEGDVAAFTGGEVETARAAVEEHCFAEAVEDAG